MTSSSRQRRSANGSRSRSSIKGGSSRRRWLGFVVVMLTSTAYTLLIQGSKDAGSFRYSFFFFLLMTAAAKAVLACVLLLRERRARAVAGAAEERDVGDRRAVDLELERMTAARHRRRPLRDEAAYAHPSQWSWAMFLRFAASAALYLVNDTLVFVVMSYFDNVSYSILVTGKVAVVAILTRTVLKRQLTTIQYLSFVILTVGQVVNQYSFCDATVETGGGGVGWEAYAVVVGAEIIGGIAGILNEYLMKQAPEQSVHFQNLNLYVASVLLYLPLCVGDLWLWRPSLSISNFPLPPILFAMLPINAVRGVSISMVYKESTNMTKIFIIACSMLLNGIFGDLLFHIQLDMQFALSFVLVAVALYLYASQKSVVVAEPANASADSPSSSLAAKFAEASRRLRAGMKGNKDRIGRGQYTSLEMDAFAADDASSYVDDEDASSYDEIEDDDIDDDGMGFSQGGRRMFTLGVGTDEDEPNVGAVRDGDDDGDDDEEEEEEVLMLAPYSPSSRRSPQSNRLHDDSNTSSIHNNSSINDDGVGHQRDSPAMNAAAAALATADVFDDAYVDPLEYRMHGHALSGDDKNKYYL